MSNGNNQDLLGISMPHGHSQNQVSSLYSPTISSDTDFSMVQADIPIWGKEEESTQVDSPFQVWLETSSQWLALSYDHTQVGAMLWNIMSSWNTRYPAKTSIFCFKKEEGDNDDSGQWSVLPPWV